MTRPTAQDIIDQAATTLFDRHALVWHPEELAMALQQGLALLVATHPTLHVVPRRWQLQPGIEQPVPPDALGLIDLHYCYAGDTLTPERAVTRVTAESLNAIDPTWPAHPPESVVEHFIYDPNNPRRFLVYPAQPSDRPAWVELACSEVPQLGGALSDPLPVPDMYIGPLGDYILSQAYTKNIEIADLNRSAMHYQRFAQAIGLVATEQARILKDAPSHG
jgi:hypothetical protein